MTRQNDGLNKKRGDRVKELFKWWNTAHPERKKTQAELAHTMSGRTGEGISAIALSAKLNDSRTLTEKDAREIAAFFPGSRFEFIMCYDDHMTWDDYYKSVFDRMEDDAKILDGLIRRILKDKNCAVKLINNDKAPEGMVIDSDSFAIIENDQVVGFISLSDYSAIRHEITDFAKYIIGKKIETCKKQMIQSFPYKEEV
ncbi:MAG: hypothetical protein IJI45_19585 [Anaerolineaceae bacterium]|nr:hypothetical protein [Anaerolineaceae bacterium]